MTTQLKELNSMTATHCFYRPGIPGIIDTLTRDQRGMFSGENVEEIQARYPGAKIGLVDDVLKLQNDFWIEAPSEITEEKFTDMLEVLPPIGWKTTEDGESFKMQEMTSGIITGIYVRIGNIFFSMQNKVTLTHEEILKIAQDKLENEDLEKCPECGHTPETGACFYCKMD